MAEKLYKLLHILLNEGSNWLCDSKEEFLASLYKTKSLPEMLNWIWPSSCRLQMKLAGVIKQKQCEESLKHSER